jgi:hypothetical protein
MKSSATDLDKVKLTKEQIVMLNLSERDIKEGRLISNVQLDKSKV